MYYPFSNPSNAAAATTLICCRHTFLSRRIYKFLTKAIFCICLFTTGFAGLRLSKSYGQSTASYSFYKDDTLVRKAFFEEAAKVQAALLKNLPKEHNGDYKKIYDQRFLLIKDLFTSARSVTAPVANDYLQQVVAKIVSANPELKPLNMRVVFSRDWWPNAYSLGEGTIAINAGLLIYLENEAQLVFALCHEIAHYYLDHSGSAIKKYVETVNSEAFQKELRRLNRQQYRVNEQLEALAKDIAFDSRKHSRNSEAAADMQAFGFMKRTGYDCNAIISTLLLLDTIDKACLFEPLDVEKAFHFETYPFKKKWIQKESAIFSAVGDDSELSKQEKDSLKTHPDCSKRISLLKDAIDAASTSGKLALVNETVFQQLKKDFIREMTEFCFTEQNLSRNLYYSLLLLQSGKESGLARYSIARCLNQVYIQQKAHSLGLHIDHEQKEYPADYNTLLRMLDKVRLDELAAINTNFCLKYKDEMKDYEGFTKEMIKALDLQ